MIAADTKPGFCFSCRVERVFARARADWECTHCGSSRALTVSVMESFKGGDSGRFWASVKQTPFCWPWIRPCTNKLGPRFELHGKSVKIARCAYFFSRGVWPVGGAFRTCHNGFCCRPDHIVDRSQADVSRTLMRLGRLKMVRPKQTRCKRGHAFTAENISIQGKQRYCRLCRNLVNRKRYRRQKREQATA